MKYELVDCRPVPAKLAPVLRTIKSRDSSIVFTSIERTQPAVDFARARGCSLSSQAELWNGWIRRLPGFNPANPPGFSTHERRSDGVAFPQWTRGIKIPYWAVGLDNTNTAALIREASELGFLATLTYPSSPSEGHHVNFRREPVIHVFKVLEKGDKGARVRHLTGRLSRLKLVHEKSGTYLNSPSREYTENVERAVRRFQEDHHLEADGKYGPHTAAQLRVSIRRQRRHDKKLDDRPPKSRKLPVP